MATATTPDGTVIQVPDGATPEQINEIMAARQKKMEEWFPGSVFHDKELKDAAKERYDEMGWFQQKRRGFFRPFMELEAGIRDLMGQELTEEQRGQLYEYQQGGGVPRFLGEIGMYAGPARLLGVLGKFGLGADLALSAGIEGTKLPEQGRTRGEAALWGAGGAGVGRGLAKTMSMTGQGIKRTPEAQAMLDADVPLTPGMASQSAFPRTMERIMSEVPGVAGGVGKLQRESVEAWNKRLLSNLDPYRMPGQAADATIGSGQAGIKELQRRISASYESLWKKPVSINPNLRMQYGVMLGNAQEELTESQFRRLSGNLKQVQDVVITGKPASGNAVSNMDDTLRDLARNADTNAESQFYYAARDQLRKAMPEQVKGELFRLDSLHSRMQVVNKAATYKPAAEAKGVFSPEQLHRASIASNQTGGKAAAASGRARLQQEAAGAQDVFGATGKPKFAEKLGIPAAAALAVAAEPTTLAIAAGTRFGAVNKPVRNMLTGQSTYQQFIDPLTQRANTMAEILRRGGVTSGSVGRAALSPDEVAEKNRLEEERKKKVLVPGQY